MRWFGRDERLHFIACRRGCCCIVYFHFGDVAAGQMAKRPGWSSLKALQQQRLCAFPPTQADILVRAGPRMGQAAQLIAQCLRRVLTP